MGMREEQDRDIRLKKMEEKMTSLDTPVETGRPSEVTEGLGTTEKYLAMQRELIGMLENKLGPVLRHDRPTPDSDGESSSVESPLGQQLLDIAHRIDLNNCSIQELIERIAL